MDTYATHDDPSDPDYDELCSTCHGSVLSDRREPCRCGEGEDG